MHLVFGLASGKNIFEGRYSAIFRGCFEAEAIATLNKTSILLQCSYGRKNAC